MSEVSPVMKERHFLHLKGDFWLFYVGQVISSLGSSITAFILPLLVFKITGSAIDLGIATFAAFSDGTLLPPLHALRTNECKLARAQQALARKVKFSQNWQKHVVRATPPPLPPWLAPSALANAPWRSDPHMIPSIS